jgi:hypothetical protein
MTSKIDDELTPAERAVLAIYRAREAYGVGRAMGLSVQYALGAAIFVYASIAYDEPLFVLAVYGILIALMTLRLIGAYKISGIMPGIIQKYEDRIDLLRRELESRAQ